MLTASADEERGGDGVHVWHRGEAEVLSSAQHVLLDTFSMSTERIA